jgi:hypothetical protein
MRFHDLRHSQVALLIEQGTQPAVIAARLGHTSVKTVLDVYGHLYEGLDREAADSLEAPWVGRLAPTQPTIAGKGCRIRAMRPKQTSRCDEGG